MKCLYTRREALRKWRGKLGPDATYGKLLELSLEAEHRECADAVCEALRRKCTAYCFYLKLHDISFLPYPHRSNKCWSSDFFLKLELLLWNSMTVAHAQTIILFCWAIFTFLAMDTILTGKGSSCKFYEPFSPYLEGNLKKGTVLHLHVNYYLLGYTCKSQLVYSIQ